MRHNNLWKTFKDEEYRLKRGRPRMLDDLRLMNKDRELLSLQKELDFNYYTNLLEVESPAFSEHLHNTHKRIE